jgi:hypothetical protein
MKVGKGIFISSVLILLFLFSISPLIAQEKYSILIGTVKGMEAKMWLEVESETDKTLLNFRVGRRTVYTPHRYPNPGERVKVEYLYHRGNPVAFTVTILQPSAPKRVPKESPK